MTDKTNENKRCFVISPIGEDDSETRKRSNQVLRHIIGPAAQQCGYDTVRADEIDKPGLITSQVIQHIVSDELVIADLTERNPNVFYELAIRHAIKKPLVQVIQKGEKIPFDVAGLRTISIDHTDLDNAAQAREEIQKQIRAVEADPTDIETPISVSLDLQALRQSDDPEERGIADIVSEISEIKIMLAKVYSENSSERIIAQLEKHLSRLEMMFFEGENRFTRGRRASSVNQKIANSFYLNKDEDSYALSIATVASLFQNNFPWIYEVGMEAFRQVAFGSVPKAQRSLDLFRTAIEQVRHGELGAPGSRIDSDMFEVLEHASHLLASRR